MKVGNLGQFIREQRRGAQLSLRKLAKLAGVSNPYLSQIERGLRRPSADILQGIAKALRISAETLYVQAGILEDRKPGDPGVNVEAAILADPAITERQKQALVEIYSTFRDETGRRRGGRKPAAASRSKRSEVRKEASPEGGRSRSASAASPSTTGRR